MKIFKLLKALNNAVEEYFIVYKNNLYNEIKKNIKNNLIIEEAIKQIDNARKNFIKELKITNKYIETYIENHQKNKNENN